MSSSIIETTLKGVEKNWKEKLLDWVFAQGSIAVVLIAWLGWTIYDGKMKDLANIKAAEARKEWEQNLWDKIDIRLTELSRNYKDALEKVIQANERKTERDEIRFDKIVDRIKGN